MRVTKKKKEWGGVQHESYLDDRAQDEHDKEDKRDDTLDHVHG